MKNLITFLFLFIVLLIPNSKSYCNDGFYLYSFGNNSWGQLGREIASRNPTMISNHSFVEVALETNHGLGLKEDGTLWAWGTNDYGQLGDGTFIQKLDPVQIGNDKWIAIAVNYGYSIGIKNDGSVWAWGLNDRGQLGDGTYTNRNIPVKIAEGNWVTAHAGLWHCFIMDNQGNLKMWGDNTFGQLGDGTYNSSNTPKSLAKTGWKALTAGSMHTLGISQNGSLWGWGDNSYGQLGDSTYDSYNTPKRINSGTDWMVLSAKFMHSMGIRSNGTLWGWGYNGSGQLGDGTTTSSNYPKRIGNDTIWTNVGTGVAHSVGRKSDSTLWTWGNNYEGQLGDGTATDRKVPTQIGQDKKWLKFSAASVSNMGIALIKRLSDGFYMSSAWSWGDNTYGQLGTGSNISHSVPRRVGNDKWKWIGTWGNTCAGIKQDGSVWTWGDNTYGQLGNGSYYPEKEPQQVQGLSGENAKIYGNGNALIWHNTVTGAMKYWGLNSNGQGGNGTNNDILEPYQWEGSWDDFTMTENSTAGIKQDGTVWTCGDNSHGQLGNGTNTSSNTPQQVQGLSGENAKIYSGKNQLIWHNTVTGAIKYWGFNSNGQGGNGTNNDILEPYQWEGSWDDFTMTENSTAGIKQDGTVWTCGDNSHGQLGNGTNTSSNTPQQVQGLSGENAKIYNGKNQLIWHNTVTGAIKYWGFNSNGQGGNGTNNDILEPYQWEGSWDDVVSNETNTWALNRDGTLWSSGDNSNGQLGNGMYKPIYWNMPPSNESETSVNVLTRVGNDNNWVSLVAGDGHCLALNKNPILLPAVNTISVGDITNNSATSMSIIVSDGGEDLTARGVCWSTSQNPTINDNKTNDGELTGLFISSIKGLKPNTKYYVRAYATNSAGTAYGKQLSFTTEGGGSHSISLISGWNMISTYVEPIDKTMDSIWFNIQNSVNLVKDISGKSYIPSFNINQIGDWNKYQGYQAFMSQNKTLEINGTELVPENTPISLSSGWSMIPYMRKSDQSIVTALATLTSGNALNIAKDISGKSYIPQFNINQIGNMQPGQGYQVYLSKNSTLTYPANSSGKVLAQDISPMPKYLIPEYSRTGNSAIAIFSVNANNGDEIGIFNRSGELIGSGAIKDNLTAVTIWGDNAQTPNIDGAIFNEELTIKYFNSRTNKFENIEISNITDYLSGKEISGLNYSNDAVFYLKGNVESKDNNLTLSVSPNPIKDNIEISLTTNDCSASNLKIYDLSGRMVQDLSSKLINSNNQTLKANLSNLSNGEYTIVLTCGNLKVSEKLIIMK